jgi:rRNA maturation protein Nop10
MDILGYCFKCKNKQVIKNAEKTTFKTKNGKERYAVKGICPVCGTKMYKILSSVDII